MGVELVYLVLDDLDGKAAELVSLLWLLAALGIAICLLIQVLVLGNLKGEAYLLVCNFTSVGNAEVHDF